MKVTERIRNWRWGRFVPYEVQPGSLFVRLGGEYQRPALAKAIDVVGRFWMSHWKWLMGTAVAVALAVYAKHRP
jgi:hypothetical protein